MVGQHATKYQRKGLLGRTHLDSIKSQSKSLVSQDRAGQPRLGTLECTLSQGVLLRGLQARTFPCVCIRRKRALEVELAIAPPSTLSRLLHPAGPRTSPDAPGAPLPPLNFTARSQGGDRGLQHPPRAGRAQRPRRGLQGHFPTSLLPRGWGRRWACSSGGAGETGERGGRRPAPPHPSLTTATPSRRGPPPGRGPQVPAPPPVPETLTAEPGRGAPGTESGTREAGATPEGAAWGGPCLHRQVLCFRPGPRIPPAPRRPGCCLPACRAGPTAPGSEPWRSGRLIPGTGRPGRGDSRGRRGPRAKRSPRATRAAGQARVGARGHPSPRRSRAGWWLSSRRRAASPCTAPGRGCEGRRASPRIAAAAAAAAAAAEAEAEAAAADAAAAAAVAVAVAAARLEPEAWSRSGRAQPAQPASAERAPPRPGPRARPRGPAGDPAPRFREGEEARGRQLP